MGSCKVQPLSSLLDMTPFPLRARRTVECFRSPIDYTGLGALFFLPILYSLVSVFQLFPKSKDLSVVMLRRLSLLSALSPMLYFHLIHRYGIPGSILDISLRADNQQTRHDSLCV